jgi:hypothetical protein
VLRGYPSFLPALTLIPVAFKKSAIVATTHAIQSLFLSTNWVKRGVDAAMVGHDYFTCASVNCHHAPAALATRATTSRWPSQCQSHVCSFRIYSYVQTRSRSPTFPDHRGPCSWHDFKVWFAYQRILLNNALVPCDYPCAQQAYGFGCDS